MRPGMLLGLFAVAVAGCTEPGKSDAKLEPQVLNEVVHEVSAGKEGTNSAGRGEGIFQEPLMTISSQYRDSDGRVKEHKFPVKFELHADGRLTGSFETWVEKRYTDGTSRLIFPTETFRGSWMMRNNTIHVTADVEKGRFFPNVAFQEAAGLKIIVRRRDL